MFEFIVSNMLLVGLYISTAALACTIVGLVLANFYPVGVYNYHPTLPVKWFIIAGLLYAASISWIIAGMIY